MIVTALSVFFGIVFTFISQSLADVICQPKDFEAALQFKGWLPGVLVYTSCIMLVFLVSGNWIFSLFVAFSMSIFLASGHALKLKYLNEPLYVSDFFPVAQRTFFGVLPGLGKSLLMSLSAALISFVVLVYFSVLAGRRFPLRISFFQRFILFVFFAAAPVALCTISAEVFRKTTSALGIAPYERNKLKNFRMLGVAGGLLYDLRHLIQVRVPDGYPHELKNLIASGQTGAAVRNRNQVDNVVILLLESFWDPMRIAQLKMLQDPIPGFHTLEKQATHGSLIVPAYGGGTIKTEFEILTGLSTAFVDGFPYNVAIRRNVKTLASVFQEQGFQTKFIHGHKRWFYGRDNIVELLGFQTFIADDAIEKEFAGNEIRDGLYVRDAWVKQMVLKELTRHEKNFIYASTYVTHAPYRLRRSHAKTCSAQQNTSTELLNQNCALLTEADAALLSLVHEIKRLKPNTLIVAFGDHFPSPTYLNIDFFSLHDRYLDAFRMPLLIIDPAKPGSRKIEIGAPALGGFILESAGLKKRGQFQALAAIHSQYPDFSHWETQETLDAKRTAARHVFNLVQYDILYGKENLWSPRN